MEGRPLFSGIVRVVLPGGLGTGTCAAVVTDSGVSLRLPNMHCELMYEYGVGVSDVTGPADDASLRLTCDRYPYDLKASREVLEALRAAVLSAILCENGDD